LKKVQLYTDGSSLGNPGGGGWASILKYGDKQKIISGGQKQVTNNQMELKAVIEGLKALKSPCVVEIFSDSKYVVDGLSKYIFNWQKNNWKTSTKSNVKNKQMWQEYLEVCKIHTIKANWIKAHNGHEQNEICDTLAKQQASLYL
jgi:ribonuclease HI